MVDDSQIGAPVSEVQSSSGEQREENSRLGWLGPRGGSSDEDAVCMLCNVRFKTSEGYTGLVVNLCPLCIS